MRQLQNETLSTLPPIHGVFDADDLVDMQADIDEDVHADINANAFPGLVFPKTHSVYKKEKKKQKISQQ